MMCCIRMVTCAISVNTNVANLKWIATIQRFWKRCAQSLAEAYYVASIRLGFIKLELFHHPLRSQSLQMASDLEILCRTLEEAGLILLRMHRGE